MTTDDTTVLDGRRVLVTGGRGFLGSALVARLAAEGADVAAPSRADYDLVDRDQVRAMFSDLRPEIVFHLAAEVGGIGANRANPGRYLYANAQMGLAVLDEARLAAVAKTLVTGTICSYPADAPVPFREDDLYSGYPEPTNAPYGLAKRLVLAQCQAYRAQYGMNAVVLLPVNLYGPGDNFDPETSHVIPALIRKCVEAVEAGRDHVTVWGDGTPTREFLHVDDAARALVLAARRYDGVEPVNVGTGREISIADLARTIAGLCGFEGELRWDRSRPNGQMRRCLDVSRARERFGFEAAIELEAGLAETVRWFREAS